MENKTIVERFKDLYGFREGIKEYIPQPGELLKYIGEDVVLLIYQKDKETDKWGITNCIVKIQFMGDYDPMTGTYKLRYDTGKEKKDSEATENYTEGIHELRVFSQGFSFENPEETGRSLRFIPFSYHYKFAEFQDFYIKLRKNYDSYQTLPIPSLEQISKSKNQKEVLESTYLCAVIKMADGEVLQFRITALKIKHRSGKSYALTLDNPQQKNYTFMIMGDQSEYGFAYGKEYIGTLKIVDLGGERDIEKKEEN